MLIAAQNNLRTMSIISRKLIIRRSDSPFDCSADPADGSLSCGRCRS